MHGIFLSQRCLFHACPLDNVLAGRYSMTSTGAAGLPFCTAMSPDHAEALHPIAAQADMLLRGSDVLQRRLPPGPCVHPILQAFPGSSPCLAPHPLIGIRGGHCTAPYTLRTSNGVLHMVSSLGTYEKCSLKADRCHQTCCRDWAQSSAAGSARRSCWKKSLSSVTTARFHRQAPAL